jgi:hypothetical protein
MTVTVKYLETDTTDEGPIRWYKIDDEVYGLTLGWKILDSDSVPVTESAEISEVRKQIVNYEAAK